jgi:LPXTG-motif cell wall-anchored protein
MEEQTPRRRLAAGIALMVMGAIGLVAAVPASAGTAQAPPTPTTSEVPDNQTCANLAPPGTDWKEFKVEPVATGDYDDGTLFVSIEVVDTPGGPTFNWSSNIGVDAVFVKGGPGGLLYSYDPPSTGDTGLHAPVNPANDKFFGLSHISFCYEERDEETTTTTEKETTTTEQETTTTEQETTTTEQETTTTEKHEETTTTVKDEETTTTLAGVTTTVVSNGELPRTGSTALPFVIGGALLLAAGGALVAGSKRLGRS